MTISSIMTLVIIITTLITAIIFVELAAIQNKFEYDYADTILQLAAPISMLTIIVLSISFFLHDYLTVWESFAGLSWVLIIAITALMIILADLIFSRHANDGDLADDRLSYGVIISWSAAVICIIVSVFYAPDVSRQSVEYHKIQDIQAVKNVDVKSYVKSANGNIKILAENSIDLSADSQYQSIGKVKIVKKTYHTLPKSQPEQTRINYQSVKIKKRFTKTYRFLESRHLLSDDDKSALQQKETQLKITRLKHVQGKVHQATNPGSY